MSKYQDLKVGGKTHNHKYKWQDLGRGQNLHLILHPNKAAKPTFDICIWMFNISFEILTNFLAWVWVKLQA